MTKNPIVKLETGFDNSHWYPGLCLADKHPGSLRQHEYFWRNNYELLLSKGYKLRSRYKPDCKHTREEERLCISNHKVCEAIRMADQTKVLLKQVEDSRKLDMLRHLTVELQSEPANKMAPALDMVHIPTTNAWLMVTPYLRDFDEPPFETVGEVLEAMSQLLEGLEFIHQQNIALRSMLWKHLVMDASEMIPKGWHFADPRTQDGFKPVKYFPRSSVNVKYYFLSDFGEAVDFTPKPPSEPQKKPPLTRKSKSTKNENMDVTYRKADIKLLGFIFGSRLLNRYEGLAALEPLITSMSAKEEKDRPEASEARKLFSQLTENMDPGLQISIKVVGTTRLASRPYGIRLDLDDPPSRGPLETVKGWFS